MLGRLFILLGACQCAVRVHTAWYLDDFFIVSSRVFFRLESQLSESPTEHYLVVLRTPGIEYYISYVFENFMLYRVSRRVRCIVYRVQSPAAEQLYYIHTVGEIPIVRYYKRRNVS